MANDKMKSGDTAPQADKQAQTEIAQHEGSEGAQARIINEQEPEKKEGSIASLDKPRLGAARAC